MSERFFLATTPDADRAVLHGDEARHLARVMRAQVGDEIRVFDGRGGEWMARVAAVGRDSVSVALGARLPAEPPPLRRLTLAVALPKGERQKWLIEKITELGATSLVPLVTKHGVAEATPAALERLRRGVIEACKQCGRATLVEIGGPATLDDLAARHPQALRLIADPHGGPLEAALAGHDGRDIVAAVGPEGGFAADELAAAERAGFTRVSLGRHILRIETAALALAARLADVSPSAAIDRGRASAPPGR